jgi:AcrR family transcriptional regulator
VGAGVRSVDRGIRIQAGGDPPPTRRGRRTRASLIEAARRVFERVGYLDARLSDITAEAGCSTGTFYTYFGGKDEVMAAVLLQLESDMLQASGHRDSSRDEDPVSLIRANTRSYLEEYQRNAMLMKCLEQVAVVSPEFQALRIARAYRFITRNANLIRELQGQEVADPDVDPDLAARALSAMVSRLAFTTYVLEDSVPLDDLVDVATRLWVNGLGIRDSHARHVLPSAKVRQPKRPARR